MYPLVNVLLAQAEDFVVTTPNRHKATLIDFDTQLMVIAATGECPLIVRQITSGLCPLHWLRSFNCLDTGRPSDPRDAPLHPSVSRSAEHTHEADAHIGAGEMDSVGAPEYVGSSTQCSWLRCHISSQSDSRLPSHLERCHCPSDVAAWKQIS